MIFILKKKLKNKIKSEKNYENDYPLVMIHSDVIQLYLDFIQKKTNEMTNIAYDPLFFVYKADFFYRNNASRANPFTDCSEGDLYNESVRSNMLEFYFSDISKKKPLKQQDFSGESRFKILECIAFISAFFAFGSRTGIIHFLAKLFSAVNLYTVVNADYSADFEYSVSEEGKAKLKDGNVNSKSDDISPNNKNKKKNLRNSELDRHDGNYYTGYTTSKNGDLRIHNDSSVHCSNAEKDTPSKRIMQNIESRHISKRDDSNISESISMHPSEIVRDTFVIDKTKLVHYRWLTKDFIFVLLHSLSEFYNKNASIEDFFAFHMKKKGNSINFIEVQNLFINELKSLFMEKALETGVKVSAHSVKFFFTTGEKSGMKRLQLFLKWMIRDTFPDTGLWKSFDKNILYYPLDTHILRITNSFAGFILRNSSSELHAVVDKISNGSIEKLPIYLNSITIDNSGTILKNDKLSKNNRKTIRGNEVYENNMQVIGGNEKQSIEGNKSEVKEIKMKDQNGSDLKILCKVSDEHSLCRSLAKDFNKVVKVRKNIKNYFDKYSGIFANKTKNIFSNKVDDMIAVTDFYRCFVPEDPLIYDFSLALINSGIKKSDRISRIK